MSKVKAKTVDVPSYSWLQQGLGHLVKACVFYFPTFSLSRHPTERIATTIVHLFQEGRITKDPKFERHWLGAFLVRRLVTCLVEDGLKNGAINWDVTMAKVMSIVLVASLASRVGDITVAPLDEQALPFLCYKDITIKLIGGSEIGNLVAEVVIRNEKGYK